MSKESTNFGKIRDRQLTTTKKIRRALTQQQSTLVQAMVELAYRGYTEREICITCGIKYKIYRYYVHTVGGKESFISKMLLHARSISKNERAELCIRKEKKVVKECKGTNHNNNKCGADVDGTVIGRDNHWHTLL